MERDDESLRQWWWWVSSSMMMISIPVNDDDESPWSLFMSIPRLTATSHSKCHCSLLYSVPYFPRRIAPSTQYPPLLVWINVWIVWYGMYNIHLCLCESYCDAQSTRLLKLAADQNSSHILSPHSSPVRCQSEDDHQWATVCYGILQCATVCSSVLRCATCQSNSSFSCNLSLPTTSNQEHLRSPVYQFILNFLT